MGPLKAFLAAASLVWTTPAPAQTVANWRPHILEAADRFGVPVAWIEAVMRAESGGRTHLDGRPIRSSAGAMGLMQLMPGTWREMRARLGLGANPDNPRDNILAGTFYLRLMYDRFGYPGLFAAYNAGPARYAEHVSARRSLPSETIGYLATVTGGSHVARSRQAAAPTNAATTGLFAIHRNLPKEARAGSAPIQSSLLFVELSKEP